MTKQVAGTLTTILENPIVQKILDRKSDITQVIPEVLNYWNYDLFSRKPGAAYQNGVFVGTDLDLACFLYALLGRGAVINIPTYKSMRQTKVKEGQLLTSKENRHGKVLGLVSNKNTFTFSIRIQDANVMTTNSIGDYRNFALTDIDGTWYDGWKKIEFLPSVKENSFLTESKLWTGNTVSFKNFVHPNRWTSFYGKYYFITKILMDRLSEESSYYFTEIKRLIENGVKQVVTIQGEEIEIPETPKTTIIGESKSIKINAFEVEVDLPNNNTEYPTFDCTSENLLMLKKKRNEFTFKINPNLRFMTRATELAIFKHGFESFPAWIKNAKWEKGYKEKGKRKLWDRLILFQPAVGDRGVAIRKRVYEKSEIVSENYEE